MRASLNVVIGTFVLAGWLGLSSTAFGQLVVGADQTTNNASIWLIDVNNPATPTRLLGPSNAAVAWGMAADDANSTLYWNNGTQLFKSPYAGTLAPSFVGTITLVGVGTTTPSAMTGMGFNQGSLFGYKSTSSGTFPVGFYDISPADATAKLVAATPASTDFGGFEYDPVTGAFYGLNDSTGLQGRGLYRIDNMSSGTPTYTRLTPYPGTDTDIDGLAIGNGRAYMVNDNSTAGQGIYVYNLTTNAFETTIPNPFSNTSAIFSSGTWAPGLLPEPTTCGLLAIVSLALQRRKRGR